MKSIKSKQRFVITPHPWNAKAFQLTDLTMNCGFKIPESYNAYPVIKAMIKHIDDLEKKSQLPLAKARGLLLDSDGIPTESSNRDID